MQKYNRIGLLWIALIVLALMLALIPAVAQEATPEATAEATVDTVPPVQGDSLAVTRIRIAHLAPDGPVLVHYLDGAPSGIQLLTYPSVSGWVEIPSGAGLSLIPEGSAQSQAVVGPVTFSANAWTTIVVAGSSADGTLRGYAVTERLGGLPENCARVTIFHAIEGFGTVDVLTTTGQVLAGGVGFPGTGTAAGGIGTEGGMTGAEATLQPDLTLEPDSTQEPASLIEAAEGTAEAGIDGQQPGDCEWLGMDQSEAAAVSMDSEATAEAGMMIDATAEATAAAGEDEDMTQGGAFRSTGGSGPVSCQVLAGAVDGQDSAGAPTDATAEATAESGTQGASAASMVTAGETLPNCAYTFGIPASVVSLRVSPAGAGTGSALIAAEDFEFASGGHYFIAVIGTESDPSIFVFTVEGSAISSLLGEVSQAEAEATIDAEVTETAPTATPSS